MPAVRNAGAGPFGAFYSFWIERQRLSRVVGRALWGIDTRPLYASMAAIAQLPDGATVLDVPCGSGVALRALAPERRIRWIAVDLDTDMLARCERNVRERGLHGVELVEADMLALPFADASADMCLSYSGLHMVGEPERALAEIVRCLKPGCELIGSTFLAEGSRRQRLLLGHGERTGQNGPLWSGAELRRRLAEAGVEDVSVAPERGFAIFRGRRVDSGVVRST
jgi:SAM-dependent methyltransferase